MYLNIGIKYISNENYLSETGSLNKYLKNKRESNIIILNKLLLSTWFKKKKNINQLNIFNTPVNILIININDFTEDYTDTSNSRI